MVSTETIVNTYLRDSFAILNQYKKIKPLSRVVKMVQVRGNWIKKNGNWYLIDKKEVCYCIEEYKQIKRNEKLILNSYGDTFSLCSYEGKQIWIPSYCLSKAMIHETILKYNLSRSLKYHLLHIQMNNKIYNENDGVNLLLHQFIENNRLDVDCQRYLRTLNDELLIELFEWGYTLNARNASALVVKRIEKIKARHKGTPEMQTLFDKEGT